MTKFDYKKYSLQHLDEWIHDALNCDEIAPKEIYDTILNVVNDSIEYHRNNLDRGVELLSLLKGHRPIEIEEATDKDWEDFWESTEEISKEQWAHPESSLYKHLQYTEEELNAMCDAAEDKEKCREYNLREAEYYTKRAKLDAEVSRNDPTRLKYEKGWVYESPDGGKTVTKRRPGSLEKTVVKADGYSTSERKHWTLPVEEVRDEDTGEDEYCITFPDDLLEAANLKEGDSIEWIDRGDGSYELRKVTQPLQMDEC